MLTGGTGARAPAMYMTALEKAERQAGGLPVNAVRRSVPQRVVVVANSGFALVSNIGHGSHNPLRTGVRNSECGMCCPVIPCFTATDNCKLG